MPNILDYQLIGTTITVRISGAHKVAAGLTTMEEVLKVAPPLQELSKPV